MLRLEGPLETTQSNCPAQTGSPAAGVQLQPTQVPPPVQVALAVFYFMALSKPSHTVSNNGNKIISLRLLPSNQNKQ